MGTTSEKLTYLNTTKQKLKQAINNIGGEVTDETTFREYVEELEGIYDNLPKTEYQEGTEVNLGKTIKGKLDFDNGVVGIGQTEQDGEPTPDTPIEIKSVTGTIEEVVRGKNVLNFVKWLENVRAYGQRNGSTGMSGGTLDSYTDNSFTFTASGNDCYSQSFTMSGTASVNKTFCELYPHLVFEVEPSTYYTLSFKRSNEALPARPMFFYLDENYNYLSLADSGSLNISSFARQTPSNCKYLLFRMGLVDHNGSTLTLSDLMLEKGNTATTYEPYKTPKTYQFSLGDHKFYGIGDYKDELVYNVNQDKVYKVNRIAKHVLTENDGWVYDGTTYNRIYNQSANFLNPPCKIPSSNDDPPNILCDYLMNYNATTFLADNSLNGITLSQNGTISARNTSKTTLEQYKSWLSEVKPVLYYVIGTQAQTQTEITDATLKAQVKAWYNAHSLNGTTIITSNGNLPMIIKVRGLKGE